MLSSERIVDSSNPLSLLQKSVELFPSPEILIGRSTSEVAKYIVTSDPRIQHLAFRSYVKFNGDRHDYSYEDPIWVGRDELLRNDWPRENEHLLAQEANFALDSRLRLTASSVAHHFQLMDLEVDKSFSFDLLAERFLTFITPTFGGGVLIDSGRSYHYFGFRILPHEEWINFLGKFLLSGIFSQDVSSARVHTRVADDRYIGHALCRGYAGLRVTAKGSKVQLPQVIRVLP